MTLKAKIKFKAAYPDGPKDDNDVIVIKVKRKHWEDFSQLLGAGRAEANSFCISESEAEVIEYNFDSLYSEHA